MPPALTDLCLYTCFISCINVSTILEINVPFCLYRCLTKPRMLPFGPKVHKFYINFSCWLEPKIHFDIFFFRNMSKRKRKILNQYQNDLRPRTRVSHSASQLVIFFPIKNQWSPRWRFLSICFSTSFSSTSPTCIPSPVSTPLSLSFPRSLSFSKFCNWLLWQVIPDFRDVIKYRFNCRYFNLKFYIIYIPMILRIFCL